MSGTAARDQRGGLIDALIAIRRAYYFLWG
jgi:hypothetical protein